MLYSIYSIISFARDMVLFIYTMYFLIRGIQYLFSGIFGTGDNALIVSYIIFRKDDGLFNIL